MQDSGLPKTACCFIVAGCLIAVAHATVSVYHQSEHATSNEAYRMYGLTRVFDSVARLGMLTAGDEV